MLTRLCLIVALLFLLGGCLNSKAGSGVRDEDANKKRAQVIIDALAHYHTDHQQYPQDLTDLVPTYLAEIPKTTFGEEFRYENVSDRSTVAAYYLFFDKDKCLYESSLKFWHCTGY